MPTLIPKIPFIRRRARQVAATPAPVALTLVAAAYAEGSHVDLTFSRAIDVDGIVGGVFHVFDGNVETFFSGAGGAALLAPATVRLTLVFESEWYDPGVVMSVNASNGIVASGDGATWAGVTDLELPFP